MGTDWQGGKDRGRTVTSPWSLPLAGWRDVAIRVAQEMRDDNVPVVAAGVAFYTWLALVPALAGVALVAGIVSEPAAVVDAIGSVAAGLSDDTAQLLTDALRDAIEASRGRLGVGAAIAAAGLLWSSSSGLDGLVKGIDIAYDEELRPFARRRGLALLLSVGAIVGAVAALALVVAYPAFVDGSGLARLPNVLTDAVRWVALAALLLLGLLVLYRKAPNRIDARTRWIIPGALVAEAVWLAGTALFVVYVQTFASYDRSYGALGGVIVLQLWLLVTAFAILLGAEVNAELEAQTRRDTTVPPEEPMGQRGAVKADELGEVPPGPLSG